MLLAPKNQQKKLHSRLPVRQHIMATTDRAIIPVITLLASMVPNRIVIPMATINGNSMDRDMEMPIVTHGVDIAAVAITNTHCATVVTFFLLCYRSARC